jgi:hypothetical protein
MKRVLTATILAALVALMGLTPTVASAAETSSTTEITLRAAPAGPVVPSVFFVNNEAQWIHDPAEDGSLNDIDGVAGCQLSVTDANGNGAVDGADVLDRAEATGCITSWDGRDDASCTDGTPVFVAEVDGLEEVFPTTFWALHLNGQAASVGVCDLALQDGDSLGFVYE